MLSLEKVPNPRRCCEKSFGGQQREYGKDRNDVSKKVYLLLAHVEEMHRGEREQDHRASVVFAPNRNDSDSGEPEGKHPELSGQTARVVFELSQSWLSRECAVPG